MENEPPPIRTDDPAALEALIEATSALHRRMTAVRDEIHRQERLPGGSRYVLRELGRRGPQTVPQIARARPASRQHIQTLVNRLHCEELVEFVSNPAHRRSRLVQLTERGRQRVERMVEREEALLGRIAADARERDLYEAAELLRRVRRALENGDWKRRPPGRGEEDREGGEAADREVSR